MSGLAALRPRDRALVTRRPLRPEDGLSLATTADMPKLPALILVATYAGLLTGAVFLGIYAAMAWATGYTANALLIATLCLVAGFVLAFATILRRGPSRAEGELLRRDIESGEVDELVLDIAEAKAFREPEHGGLMYFLRLGDGRVFFDSRGGIADAGWDRQPEIIPEADIPRQSLHLLYGPFRGRLLGSRFSGPAVHPVSVSIMKASPDYWPAPGTFRKTAWSEIEKHFAAAGGVPHHRAPA